MRRDSVESLQLQNMETSPHEQQHLRILELHSYSPHDFVSQPVTLRLDVRVDSGAVFLASRADSQSSRDDLFGILLCLGMAIDSQALDKFRQQFLLNRRFGEGATAGIVLPQEYAGLDNHIDLAFCLLSLLQELDEMEFTAPFEGEDVMQFVSKYSKGQMLSRGFPCYFRAVVGASSLDKQNYGAICSVLGLDPFQIKQSPGNTFQAELPGIQLTHRVSVRLDGPSEDEGPAQISVKAKKQETAQQAKPRGRECCVLL